MVFSLRREFKDIKRFEKILITLLEEGLGHYLRRAKLHWHLPWHKQTISHKKLSDQEELALRLRKSFEKLGPTFVKLGQLLSLRPDLVPPEFAKEFSKLQGAVEPFAFKEVKRTIEEELGQPLDKLFKKFEKTPYGCASMAQVHIAYLKNGKKVAVKVQRPFVEEMVREDVDILLFLAKRVEKHFPKLKNYRPIDIVKEFSFYTKRELDFRIEAQNATRLALGMKKNKRVKIPKVYEKLSSRRVLTMEFLEGIRFDEPRKIKRAKIDLKQLARDGFMIILEQSLLHGFFHADPHPANIFVQKDGKIVFIDFGIMGELSRADRRKMLQFFTLIPEKSAERSVDIILSLAREVQFADLRQFRKDATRILEEVYYHEVTDKSVGKAVYEVISQGARHGVIFDPNHVLMAKAIYQGEGLMLKVDPDFKVVEGVASFVKKYLKMQLSPKGVAEHGLRAVWATKDFLEEFPEHLQKVIERLEEPDPPQRFDARQLHEFEEEIRKMNRKKNISLVASTLFVASIILFSVEGRDTLFGLPLSVVLFSLALALVLYMLIKKI